MSYDESASALAGTNEDVFFSYMACTANGTHRGARAPRGDASYPPLDVAEAFAAEVLCQDLAVTRGALAFVAADGGAAGAARRAAPPPRRPFGLHKPWAYNLDMRVFEAWRRELLADLEARVLAAGVARAASDARCVAGAAAASDIYEGV